MAYWGLDIDSILRQVNQKRASGGYVDPSTMQNLMQANISNASQQAAQQQQLDTQSKSLAETIRSNANTERERSREFDINQQNQKDAVGAQSTSNIASMVTQLPMNVLAGKTMYNKLFPTEPTPPPNPDPSGASQAVAPNTATPSPSPTTGQALNPDITPAAPAPASSFAPGGVEGVGQPGVNLTGQSLSDTSLLAGGGGEATLAGAPMAPGQTLADSVAPAAPDAPPSSWGSADAFTSTDMAAGEAGGIAGVEGSEAGATLAGVGGTLASAIPIAGAAITAANYGMPVLGNMLGAQSKADYAKDPSSNVMTQGANITAHEWDRPVEAGMQDLGLPVPGQDTLVGNLLNPGSALLKNCCFIFISAYSELLPIVRRYRDEHMNETNRRGYYRIADKIVPLMDKYPAFKWLVRFCMTGPMVSYGKYFYGEGKVGVIFKPIAKFWLGFFELFGKKPYIRSNGEVV